MARVFIEGNHKCLPESDEYKLVEKIGCELAKKDFVIVSSAGIGVSEAAFVGAKQGNANSKRVAIDCYEMNTPRNSQYSDIVVAENYFDMKMQYCINSDSFLFFSGGFEVLSTLATILQLKQLELMGKKPVICVGEQLEEALNAYGFYNEDVLDLFEEIILVSDKAEEVVNKTVEVFQKLEKTHRFLASSLGIK